MPAGTHFAMRLVIMFAAGFVGSAIVVETAKRARENYFITGVSFRDSRYGTVTFLSRRLGRTRLESLAGLQ
jgi:hypothetical protein